MGAYSNAEKRKYFRHPFNVPIKLKIANNGESLSTSHDISEGGLSFFWNEHLTKGRAINITIPVKEKRFRVRGQVAYSEKDAKTGFYRTGVAFTDATSAFRAKLAEETLEILRYQKKISKALGHAVPEEVAAREWIQKYAGQFSV